MGIVLIVFCFMLSIFSSCCTVIFDLGAWNWYMWKNDCSHSHRGQVVVPVLILNSGVGNVSLATVSSRKREANGVSLLYQKFAGQH